MSSKTLAGSAYFYEVHILIQNLGKINHIHQHIMNFWTKKGVFISKNCDAMSKMPFIKKIKKIDLRVKDKRNTIKCEHTAIKVNFALFQTLNIYLKLGS